MLDKLKQLFTISATGENGIVANNAIVALSPQDAHTKLSQKGVVMIDVREPDEYRAGHVKGSTLMPLGTVSQRWQELSSFEEVIVICRSGNRSMVACRQLSALGITKVANLHGGIMAWASAQLPVHR